MVPSSLLVTGELVLGSVPPRWEVVGHLLYIYSIHNCCQQGPDMGHPVNIVALKQNKKIFYRKRLITSTNRYHKMKLKKEKTPIDEPSYSY
jgi:hypothetical protein